MLYIETRRLILKPHTLANLERLHEWENDPELNYLSSDQPDNLDPETLDDTRRYLERIIPQSGPDGMIIHYAVHIKENDLFIGNGMIAMINRFHRRCMLGIAIGDRSQWGKGYGHEALDAILDYCFTAQNMNRVGAEIYAYNDRSIRLFEGLGFHLEGRTRQNVWKKGAFADELCYGILRSEWEALRKKRPSR